jgi:hypothetical protein
VSRSTVGRRRAVFSRSGVCCMRRTVARSRGIDNCGVEHSATFGGGRVSFVRGLCNSGVRIGLNGGLQIENTLLVNANHGKTPTVIRVHIVFLSDVASLGDQAAEGREVGADDRHQHRGG